MLETGFLPAADPRARWVTDFLQRRGGLLLGMCEFTGGVDHAYTYGYWKTCIERGEPERAVLGFYGSLAYGMSRGTFAGVEVTHLETGDNEPTLPHLYSCTQQIRLLRTMLLREDGEDLVIGSGTPRAWLETGKTVVVERAPTRFGSVSFRIESRLVEARVLARLDADFRRPPRSVRLTLRVPGGARIASARSGGRELEVLGPDTVRLEALKGTTVVEVRY
jgi:hypothetical protein